MSKLTDDGRLRHPHPRRTDDIQDRDLHQPQGRRSFPNVFRNKGRKQVYEHYWDYKAVKDGLSSGQLVLGSLRINQRNYADAFISHPKGDADVFIPGTIARNRSLTGDAVVVCLEPLKKWRVYDSFLSEKVLKWTSTNHTNLKVGKASFVTVEEFLRHDPEAFDELFENPRRDLKNHLEGFADPIDLSDEPSARVKSTERLPWWQLIQRVGRVVAIYRRLNCRVCVGFLRPTVSSSQKQKEKDVKSSSTSEWQLALFFPMDSRMPRIVIPRSSCPPDFVRQPEIFNAVRFVARIIEWSENSLFPKGELVRQFGHEQTSFIDAETDRILANVGFPFGVEEVTRFPKAVESYVSDELMGRFSPAVLAVEYARRRDFRAHCVFTIDPRTARDLDDALHVRRLTSSEVDLLEKKGVHGAAFEVGVHIADVSFYVLPEDPLDVEAASRATSIYLVQLCVPMLPRLLCEDLCSLHPGTDKLTFSVVFVLTEEAQILSNWFGRTTIHSRAKLSYEDAQAFLADPNRDWQPSDFANLESGTDVKEICRSVLILNELAVKMRGRRLQNGALQLNQVKPVFTLAETTSLPVAMAPFIVLESNRLVEEWMLAANEAVANLLASRLPHTAFLRRHPPPTGKQIMDACSLLRYSGVDVNVISAGAIQSSLNRLSDIDEGAVWQHSEDSALCASMLNLVVEPRDPTELAADDAGKSEKEMCRLSKEARLLATLNVLTKCMNLAEYFCLGAALSSSLDPDTVYTRHYALNMDHYTHFTSPIRRYADIVVHRQLAHILAVASEKANSPEVARAYHATCTSKVLQRPDQLAAIADFCNARKLDSRRASEESVEVFFTVFVKECGPLTEVCSVLNVLNQSFDVLILCTGVVRRVYLNRLDLCSYKYEAAKTGCKGSLGTGTLHLRWNIRPPVDKKALKETRLPASLISDPAVVSAVPAPAEDDCLPSSPPAPAPCGCFYQELRLFDVCRCLLTVDEVSHLPSSPEDSNNNSTNRSLKMTTFRGFDAYWPRPFINRMLNADLLVEGCLRYTSPNLAYVVNPSDGNRIFIFAKALNRAFPNDIVAVKLNGPDQWRVRASLEESEDEPSRAASPVIPAEAEEELLDESAEDLDSLSSPSPPRFQLTIDTSLEAKDPDGGGIYPTVREVLQNSPSLLSRLFPEAKSVTELVLQEQKPLMPLPSQHLLRTGRVVGVLCENSAGRRLVGHLVFESALLLPSAFVEVEELDESARPRQGVVEGFDGLPTMVPNASCFFVPESPNIPRIKLAPSSVPDDLWENPHKAEGVRYICKVRGWSPSSPYPNGVLCGQIGNPKEIEPATREILLSHGIHEDDFTHEMLKYLPASEADFQIPNYEYLRRRDFRSHCVISVDPSTAKDLDDALHIRLCAKDTFEVGVHIADVSFFVRPMTPLDREAANRTTSIYLVQRAIPMLPAILSEHLCSLNPGVDRLAFSVVFRVDKEANIFNVWFGRTVIRSCARLSYEDAMALLETPRENLDSLASRIPVHGPFSLGNVKRSLTYLDMLAQKMRKRRIDSGALHLEKVQLQFDLVPDEAECSTLSTASNEAGGRKGGPAEARNSSGSSKVLPAGWPRGYVVKKRDRAHYLIEEWMLAANEAVARRLFYHVIKQKHREVLLTADSDSVDTAAITAAIGSSAICFAEAKSKGLRSSTMGTILRRHPPPRTAKMQQLVKIADCAGISMDVSSAGALRASLDNYIAKLLGEGTPQSKVDCLSIALSYLTYMRMKMALYFNVEDVVDRAIRKTRNRVNPEKSPPSPRGTDGSWESSLLAFSHHFGLNVPLYTHFTSPIRRYADLLVHRQLADLLGCGHWSCPRPSSSSDGPPPAACPPRRPTVQAAWCNRMRRQTRRAQEKSQQLFFAAWIKSSGLVQESAVVLDVTRSKIQLLIPSCGLVINHQLQTFCRGASEWQLEDRSTHTSAPCAPCVTVRWESGETRADEEGEGNTTPLPTTKLSLFSVCQVGLTCSSRGFYVKAELLPPHASQPPS